MSGTPISLPRKLRVRAANTSTPAPGRRSSAQVEQDNAEKLAQKRLEVEQNQIAVVDAARYEYEALRKTRSQDVMANSPVNPEAPTTKVKRTRSDHAAPQDSPSHSPGFDGPAGDVSTRHTSEESDDTYTTDNGLVDPTAHNEDLHPEKLKKGQTREMMAQLRHDFDDEANQTSEYEGVPGKRKAIDIGAADSPLPKKSKGAKPKAIPTGFRPNWDVAGRQTEYPDPVTQKSHDVFDDDEMPGGFSDDDGGEAMERAGLQQTSAPARFRFAQRLDGTQITTPGTPAITVRLTTSIKEFVSPSVAADLVAARFKKSETKPSHVPAQYNATFKSMFLPRIYQLMASKDNPWDAISQEGCDFVWGKSFPNDEALTAQPGLLAIIYKVTQANVSTLKNKLAAQAIKCLESSILPSIPVNEGMTTAEARAAWIEWSLDGKEHEQVFYYRQYTESDDEGVKPTKQGLFQSQLISSTLGVYYSAITPLTKSAPSEVNGQPRGALVLAIQAVKRALNLYATGEFVRQTGPLSNFSKANWDDREDYHQGKRVAVKTTSKLMRIVGKLTDDQWAKIASAAIAESNQKTPTAPPASTPSMITEGSDDSDFELVDDDAN
ncbi:hypothetical protein BKA70DRAFT_1236478 [Coprinopsis sp. MPI-PUGE-AT-0042]|nr:hypothetical protein BKA70DRAFT_1236478 [Coprinopsis sp. MPI-PUGE-AT-0042]